MIFLNKLNDLALLTLRICGTLYVLIVSSALTNIKAQSNQLKTIDSLQQTLYHVKEADRAEIYFNIGRLYYSIYNLKSYDEAMSYYLKGIDIAERYNLKDAITEGIFLIASVYDATGTSNEKTIEYYFKYYGRLLERKNYESPDLTFAAFYVAHAYKLDRDSLHTFKFIKLFEQHFYQMPKTNQEKWKNEFKIALSNLYMDFESRKKEFIKLNHEIDFNATFNEKFYQVRRIATFIKARYETEIGKIEDAINTYTTYLNKTEDSSVIHFLPSLYAQNKEYIKAYETQLVTYDLTLRNFKENIFKDLNLKLAKANNSTLSKEKEMLSLKQEAQARQNKILFTLLGISILLLVLALYYGTNSFFQRRELLKRNAEKETLMKEIHHRVKNNLQLVYSMLDMYQSKQDNKTKYNVLNEAKIKVKGIALLHENLYNTDNDEVKLDKYFKVFIDHILKNFNINKSMNAYLDIDPIELSSVKTLPLALMIDEMVMNSIKYGVSNDKQSELSLSIKDEIGKIVVNYKDNGEGVDESFNLQTDGSLGMKLIFLLAKAVFNK